MKPIEELDISPWPWRVRNENHGSFVSSSDGSQSVAFCGEETVFSDGKAKRTPRKRNARLIAAAPEMYEALAAMLHCAEKEAPYTDMSHMSIAMDMARKALAKAAGER